MVSTAHEKIINDAMGALTADLIPRYFPNADAIAEGSIMTAALDERRERQAPGEVKP